MLVFYRQIFYSKDIIFNESKFPYADLFETATSPCQSTSSSIPFQFHSIPIIQSPNPSQPPSNSPDVGQSASVSAQSSSNHQPVQSDSDIPIPASSLPSSPVQSPNTEPTDPSLPVTVTSIPAINPEANILLY